MAKAIQEEDFEHAGLLQYNLNRWNDAIEEDDFDDLLPMDDNADETVAEKNMKVWRSLTTMSLDKWKIDQQAAIEDKDCIQTSPNFGFWRSTHQQNNISAIYWMD